MQKVENILIFSNKRNLKLITPCCNRSNLDGKFVNYKDQPEQYGYCHSCGKSSLPPTFYKNDKGEEFTWNEILNCFEPTTVSYLAIKPLLNLNGMNMSNQVIPTLVLQKYISFNLVLRYLKITPENNLLRFIRTFYGNEKAELAKNHYHLGTAKDGGTIFWYININQKVQKAKISYYNLNGKRTNKFKVPFKNEEGYRLCLYGEHLLYDTTKPIILVESEKTAIICWLFFPNYCWLAYSGINGLTKDKYQVLSEKKVLIIPDISSKAVDIIKRKLPELNKSGIDAQIWDMTEGKSDQQLKEEGLYNCDLEDLIKSFHSI